MKKLFAFGVLIFLLTAFAATFLETLNIDRSNAEWGIWNSFANGAYGGPTSKAWHNLAAPVQVSLVKEIGAFAKAYTRSQDFAKRYSEFRENQKPSAPEPFKGVEGMKKEQKEQLTKSISQMKESMKGQSTDIKKSLEEGIKTLEETLKEVDNPENPMFSAETNDIMKQTWDQQQAEYKQALAAWEQEYPSSPQAIVKKRLSYFLELSASVDFTAKLGKGQNGKMVFLNSEYEEKPSDWKLIYRCGKESVNAARDVAQQWLAELKP